MCRLTLLSNVCTHEKHTKYKMKVAPSSSFVFLLIFPRWINEFGCVVMQPGCDLLLTQLLFMDPLLGIKCSLQLPYFIAFTIVFAVIG